MRIYALSMRKSKRLGRKSGLHCSPQESRESCSFFGLPSLLEYLYHDNLDATARIHLHSTPTLTFIPPSSFFTPAPLSLISSLPLNLIASYLAGCLLIGLIAIHHRSRGSPRCLLRITLYERQPRPIDACRCSHFIKVVSRGTHLFVELFEDDLRCLVLNIPVLACCTQVACRHGNRFHEESSGRKEKKIHYRHCWKKFYGGTNMLNTIKLFRGNQNCRSIPR